MCQYVAYAVAQPEKYAGGGGAQTFCLKSDACTVADPGIYFGGQNQVFQSKVEGEAQIEGAKRPRTKGEARI